MTHLVGDVQYLKTHFRICNGQVSTFIWDYVSQVDRHVGEALEAMRELEKHISQKKENKAQVSRPSES